MSARKIILLISIVVFSFFLSGCPAIINPENVDPEIASTLFNLSGDSSIKSFAVRGIENNQFVFTHYGDVETYENDNPSSDEVQSGKVQITLPPGSNADNITPYLELTGDAEYSPSGSVDFNGLNLITVVAEDGTERIYDFTYELEASYGDQITGFMFKKATNPGTLYSDIMADSIDHVAGTILLTIPNSLVPSGLSPTNFVPSFELQGANGSGIESGVTLVDYSALVPFSPVGKNYNITVNVLENNLNEMTSFKLYKADNPILTADYTGTITGSVVNLTLPMGTDITSLSPAVLISSEASITDPLSLTGIDFSASVPFTVTAEDGTANPYTVNVTAAAVLSSQKDITFFEFNNTLNPILTSSYPAVITGNDITVNIPPTETDISSLEPTIFVSTDASYIPGGVLDFSSADVTPLVYTVTAEDFSTQDYNVSVTRFSDLKDITAFTFDNVVNPSLTVSYPGFITGNDINIDISTSEDITSLTATMALSPASSAAPGGGQDFTGTDVTPLVYTVTAEDGSTQDYNVYVNVLSDLKDITSLVFDNVVNPSLTKSYIGIITGTDISVNIPPSEGILSLTPTITVSPSASASPGGGQDFTGTDVLPFVYTVAAEDGSTQDFNVYVTRMSDEKVINSFLFDNGTNPSLAATYTGVITGTDITVGVPGFEDLTSLTPSLSISPLASAVPGGPQDFTGSDVTPFIYTITAEDGSTQDYNVSVHILSDLKDITAFSFDTVANPSLSRIFTGTVTGSDINVSIISTEDITSLEPTIALSPGASVLPAGQRNFTGSDILPLVYTVTAEDLSTQDYNVYVTVTAPAWMPVGGAVGFSDSTATGLVMDLLSDDRIVLGYRDSINSDSVSALIYDGVSWNDLGNRGYTGGLVTELAMTVDPSDNVYIANQLSTAGDIRISEYTTGPSWGTIGTIDVDVNGSMSDMTTTDSGNMYIIYKDVMNADQVTVSEYDGALTPMLTTGFTAGLGDNSPSYKITSIADTLYAAYYDNAFSFSPVMFTGATWQYIGGASFAGTDNDELFDFIEKDGIIYSVTVDGGNLQVRKYDGVWTTMGSPVTDASTTTNIGNFMKLAVNSSGDIYLFYRDLSFQPNLVKINSGGSTIPAEGVDGADLVNTSSVAYGNISIDSLDRVYLSYRDDSNGQKITVLVYE